MKREKLFHNLLLRADKCECIKQCVGCLFLHVCISGKNVRTPKWKQKKSVCDDIFRIHCQWRRRCLTRKADDFIIANTLIQPPIGKTCRHFLYVRTYNKHSRTSFPRVHKKWMREKSAAFRLWCRQFSLLLFGFSSERSRNVDELVVNDSSFWEGSNPTGDANKWRRVTKKCHENVIIQSNEIWNTLPKCHLSVELLRRRHRCGRWFKIYRNLIKLISK